ncbi:electron transfer flavoprotein subunit beta/FixA family protein [Vallitalea okinawensis]|uniref:electron transfer flavoprotein subunit beta/FixA family protein n=1 Tax=Vallitalea okinawensis TaxID=2078660 RepID=UPI000CFBDE55|nr:electron transfer flavoprotein subunit beta/FixA family protein [Vallitalea okinawensis]
MGLKMAICVKQVPNNQDKGMDFQTGNLDRKTLGVTTNPYDLVAVETGLQIKDRLPDSHVDVFSMGPKRAEKTIKECYALGADDGYLISDKAFSGSDVLATAYTIAKSIEIADDYDLIICGKQTTDGDTGQVGASISVRLDVPYIGNVCEIVEINEAYIIVRQDLGTKIQTIKCQLPCLIAVEKDIYISRLASLKLKIQAKKKEINHFSLSSHYDHKSIGIKGSPTKVSKVYSKKLMAKNNVLSVPLVEVKNIIYNGLGINNDE